MGRHAWWRTRIAALAVASAALLGCSGVDLGDARAALDAYAAELGVALQGVTVAADDPQGLFDTPAPYLEARYEWAGTAQEAATAAVAAGDRMGYEASTASRGGDTVVSLTGDDVTLVVQPPAATSSPMSVRVAAVPGRRR